MALKYLVGDQLRYRHLLLQSDETDFRSHFHYFVAHHYLLIYFIFVGNVDLLKLSCRCTFAAVPLEIFSFQLAVHLLEHWSSRASLPIHCFELVNKELHDLFHIFLIFYNQIYVLLLQT